MAVAAGNGITVTTLLLVAFVLTTLTVDVANARGVLLYLPLDERFTTRDAFLNLGTQIVVVIVVVFFFIFICCSHQE